MYALTSTRPRPKVTTLNYIKAVWNPRNKKYIPLKKSFSRWQPVIDLPKSWIFLEYSLYRLKALGYQLQIENVFNCHLIDFLVDLCFVLRCDLCCEYKEKKSLDKIWTLIMWWGTIKKRIRIVSYGQIITVVFRHL